MQKSVFFLILKWKDDESYFQALQLIVDDANDVAPEFTSELIKASVGDNCLPGQFIAKLSAKDEVCFTLSLDIADDYELIE